MVKAFKGNLSFLRVKRSEEGLQVQRCISKSGQHAEGLPKEG